MHTLKIGKKDLTFVVLNFGSKLVQNALNTFNKISLKRTKSHYSLNIFKYITTFVYAIFNAYIPAFNIPTLRAKLLR